MIYTIFLILWLNHGPVAIPMDDMFVCGTYALRASSQDIPAVCIDFGDGHGDRLLIE